MNTYKRDSLIKTILKYRDVENYKVLNGKDPTATVFDMGKSVLKVAEMDSFYAQMHMHALEDIHHSLAPIKVVPELVYMDYIDGFVITEFERIDRSEELPSAFEMGYTLGKAHCELRNIKVRKAFPWDGFYGEKEEFLCIVPLIENSYIRDTAKELLKYITVRNYDSDIQYIHRDLNPDNIIKSNNNVYLIDWDMAHGGYIYDDVAMSICCLGTLAPQLNNSIESFGESFLRGYRKYLNKDWAYLDSKVMLSAIALAGLRQGVSGWFSDRGDLSASYWVNILNRMKISLGLCHLLNK